MIVDSTIRLDNDTFTVASPLLLVTGSGEGRNTHTALISRGERTTVFLEFLLMAEGANKIGEQTVHIRRGFGAGLEKFATELTCEGGTFFS